MKNDFSDIFDALDFTNQEREIFLQCIESIRSAPEEGKDPISEVVSTVKELADDEV